MSDTNKTIRSLLLDRTELAEDLGISTRTLDRWAALRTGPPKIRIGKKIFYRKEAVLLWLIRSEERNNIRQRSRPAL